MMGLVAEALNCGSQSGEINLTTKYITENDTYYAKRDGFDGYSTVTVDVSKNIKPITITGDGYYIPTDCNGYNPVNVKINKSSQKYNYMISFVSILMNDEFPPKEITYREDSGEATTECHYNLCTINVAVESNGDLLVTTSNVAMDNHSSSYGFQEIRTGFDTKYINIDSFERYLHHTETNIFGHIFYCYGIKTTITLYNDNESKTLTYDSGSNFSKFSFGDYEFKYN